MVILELFELQQLTVHRTAFNEALDSNLVEQPLMGPNNLRESFIALALGALPSEGWLLQVTVLANDGRAVCLTDHRDMCRVLADQTLQVLGRLLIFVDEFGDYSAFLLVS
jgi:hypothetical protein